MYAGTLAQEYGIKVILDTFEQIQDEKLELWIFGDGDMKTYIEKLCNENKTIKYFGFLPHDEVFDYEKRATLLVNFRDPQDKYTSYSFPSKTFEYMVSGTPFLTTKLKGIPDEYYNYLFTVDKYSIDNLKDKIIEILNMNSDELDLVGFKARNFIIETKNSLVQATKIIKKIQNDLIK
ncbi:glycosyltransferase [Paenibacillus rhizoplanae]